MAAVEKKTKNSGNRVSKPGSGIGPLLAGGVNRDFKSLCDGVVVSSGEMTKFHHAGREWVLGGQSGQGVVERKQPIILVRLGDFAEFDAFESAAVLLTTPATGGIDKDAPHCLGGRAEEVSTILPAGVVARADQAEIGFVHEGGGLKCLIARFVRHSRSRKLSQFVVDERKQFGGSLAIARRGGVDEESHVSHDRFLLDSRGAVEGAVLRKLRRDLNQVCFQMEMCCGEADTTGPE